MSVHLQLVNQRNFQFHPKSADDSSTDCGALSRIWPIKRAKPLKVSYVIMPYGISCEHSRLCHLLPPSVSTIADYGQTKA